MDPWEWIAEWFRRNPNEGGIGGGTPGGFALGVWAAEVAQVPYVGPYLGALFGGREDLSSLTPGDDAYARREVYERETVSSPWRRVGIGDSKPGLEPGVLDFTEAVSWRRSDILVDIPDADMAKGRRQDLRNPNLLADNQSQKFTVETEIYRVARPTEIGGRPELNLYFKQDWGGPAAPPPPIDEANVRGVRPERSPPFRGTPSGVPPSHFQYRSGVPREFYSLIELPSSVLQEWGRRESPLASEFRPERDSAPRDERSFWDRDRASDWTTQTEWRYPPPDRRLIQPISQYETGSRLMNFALNKVILPWRNALAFYANIPLAVAIGVDDGIENSEYRNDLRAVQTMMPMSRAMGLAIEGGSAIGYALGWLSALQNNPRFAAALYAPIAILSGGVVGGFGKAPRSVAAVAERSFESGLGKVGEGVLGFSSYHTSGTVAKKVGFMGARMEGAHILPQAIGHYVPGYKPGRALVTLLPRSAHLRWDGPWVVQWNARVANQVPTTAGEVYTMLDGALMQNTELSAAVRGTIGWRLFEEMFVELGLEWKTTILP